MENEVSKYKGVADLAVDIHSDLLSVRDKFIEVAGLIKDMHSKLGQVPSKLQKAHNKFGEAVKLFRELNDFVPQISAALGKNPPQIKFDSKLKAIVKEAPVDNAEFMEWYVNTIEKENDNVQKMFMLDAVMKRLADVAESLRRKEKKLVERRKNGAGSDGEDANSGTLLVKVRANISAANSKYQFCMEKFLTTRRAIIARMFGITETAFRNAKKLSMRIPSLQLQKHSIKELCDELVGLDGKAPKC